MTKKNGSLGELTSICRQRIGWAVFGKWAGRQTRANLKRGAIVLAVTLFGVDIAAPQAIPSIDPSTRPGEEPPFTDELPRATPPPPLEVLPAAPELPLRNPFMQGPRLRVRRIIVTGSTVFTKQEIEAVTRPYLDRYLSAEGLEEIRLALTTLYVQRGYVDSGAVLPDQDAVDGIVRFEIVEGKVTNITVTGLRWFRPDFLENRIELRTGPPLNTEDLQERLQLFLEDARIKRLKAELKPGIWPGESELQVNVEERFPVKAAVQVDNYQSPSVGSVRQVANLEHQNVTGHGDIMFLQYGRTEGLDPIIDASYRLPINRHDTTLGLRYAKNNFAIVEEQFRSLDITGSAETYSVGLNQPLYRSLAHDVALEFAVEREWQQTSLLGTPFSLSPGAEGGKSVVAVVRIAPEWIYRSRLEVIAFRSRFSVGTDALGSTIHDNSNLPDSKFFAWLAQFQWARRLPVFDTTFVLRSQLQLSNQPLLPQEQIPIGGRYSVRGYRENTLVRDDAVIGSLELRVPIVRNQRWAEILEIVPFADYGRGWNASPTAVPKEELSSVGVGMRWSATFPGELAARPAFEVYWGHPLKDIHTAGNDFQDRGIHFQFTFQILGN